MNLLKAALRRVAADLESYDVPWALVGGFAVSARAEPRFTHDVDIAVSVGDDAKAENLIRSMTSHGYRVLTLIDHELSGRLATVRLGCPIGGGEEVVVDLLFSSSGIESEVAAQADEIDIVPGLRLPVATTGHLIALKLLARDDESRPQDAADLRALHAVASSVDLEAAQEAVTLIAHRGYDRGRDLKAALQTFLG